MAKKKPTPPKEKRGKKSPRGQGKGPSRTDMALTRKALRQDWPTSPDVKQLTLDTIIGFMKTTTRRGRAAADRTVLMAAQTLAIYCRLTLQQAELDLHREKQHGKKTDISLADLVGEAEKRAEARRLEMAEEK